MGVGVLRHHYLQFNYGSLHVAMNKEIWINIWLERVIFQNIWKTE